VKILLESAGDIRNFREMSSPNNLERDRDIPACGLRVREYRMRFLDQLLRDVLIYAGYPDS